MKPGAEFVPIRVFLLGCSRSGTTVVQRCLANHPDACSFPETGFFRQIGGPRFWAALANAGVVRAGAVRRAWGRLARVVPGLKSPLIPKGSPFLGTRGAVQDFLAALDAYALDRDCRAWVEKTPRHYRYAALIRRHVPDAYIVHVVRDGRDVTASIRDRAQTYPDRFGQQFDPAVGVREWNRAVRIAWDQRKAHRVRILMFSDFVADPEASLRALCAWMGWSYAPEMLSDVDTDHIRRTQEVWKEGAAAPITPPRSKFQLVFDAKERRWVERHLDQRTYARLIQHLRQHHGQP